MRALAALLGCSLLMGCGYGLVGRTSVLPENIRVIVVVPFENRTQRPEIEQRVTESVAREMSRRGKYEVVTDRSTADAMLEGAITGYRTVPVQFSSSGLATRAEASVTLQATLRDLATEEVLWSQAGLTYRSQFDIPEGEEFFDQETLTIEQIARLAGQGVVTSILEGF